MYNSQISSDGPESPNRGPRPSNLIFVRSILSKEEVLQILLDKIRLCQRALV